MKKPCDSCPFVRGHAFPLLPERVQEIRDNRGEFPCHQTVDYDSWDDDDDDGASRDQAHEVHCVGHLIVQWSDWGGFNQLQAMAARFGLFDPQALPTPAEADVFATWDEMIVRMRETQRRP
jgi:hypothetical protein